jgi:hypothetical protein
MANLLPSAISVLSEQFPDSREGRPVNNASTEPIGTSRASSRQAYFQQHLPNLGGRDASVVPTGVVQPDTPEPVAIGELDGKPTGALRAKCEDSRSLKQVKCKDSAVPLVVTTSKAQQGCFPSASAGLYSASARSSPTIAAYDDRMEHTCERSRHVRQQITAHSIPTSPQRVMARGRSLSTNRRQRMHLNRNRILLSPKYRFCNLI